MTALINCYAAKAYFQPAIWEYVAYAKNTNGEIVKIVASFKYGLDGAAEDVFCKVRANHKHGCEILPIDGLYGYKATKYWTIIQGTNGYEQPSMQSLMYWFDYILPNLDSIGYQIVPEEEYEYQEFAIAKGIY